MDIATTLSSCLTSATHTWCPADVPQAMRDMFQGAVHALQEEDLAVRSALTTGHDLHPGGYDGLSRGLAYWVFETGLVYSIWKAWTPRMVTRWEHPYGGGSTKAADLVVFPSSNEGWVVEAKWWNANTKQAEATVLSDVAKLQAAKGFPDMVNPLASGEAPCNWRAFLMTFAWGDSTEMDKEWQSLDALLRRRSDLALAALGAFPTHVNRQWGDKAKRGDIETGYFALAVLGVSPTRSGDRPEPSS